MDTDVVIIGCALCDDIGGVQELCMYFGVDKSRRYYPIHKIVIDLGGRCKALIFSTLYLMWPGILFCKAWKTWKNFPEVSDILIVLSSASTTELVCKSMQSYFCLMFKPTNSCESVDDLRRELFTKEEGRNLKSIQPTLPALFQDIQQLFHWTFVLSVIGPSPYVSTSRRMGL